MKKKFETMPVSITVDELNKYAPKGYSFLITGGALHIAENSTPKIFKLAQGTSINFAPDALKVVNIGNREFLPPHSVSAPVSKLAEKAMSEHTVTKVLPESMREMPGLLSNDLLNVLNKLFVTGQLTMPLQETVPYALRFTLIKALSARLEQPYHNTKNLRSGYQLRLQHLYNNHGKKSGVGGADMLAKPKTARENAAIINLLKQMQNQH